MNRQVRDKWLDWGWRR